jgi:transcriptional antiterminator RfaH
MQPLMDHTLPILPAEPDFYPPELWRDPESVPRHNSESVWWCLHTKPRQEKATARELRKGELTFYLPQVLKEDRTPQGRKIRSVIPLFSSYLFLLGDLQDRLTALRGNRLVSVLEVSDQETIEHDLRQIHRMLSSGLPVQPEPTVPVGAKVRITSGPLTGVEGTVIRRANRDQFVAVVQFLGRGATVDLQDWQVEQVIEA